MHSRKCETKSPTLIYSNSELRTEDGSNIVQFFNGKTVFLTGATGFLGKLIFEKLMRTCKDVKRVYILVRPKKGVEVNDRIEQLFSGPAMDWMKKENPKFKEQVSLIVGDLLLPNLGMSASSIQCFKDEVNIVIHCGATVRFDQKLREAVYINIRSVKDLINISKETKGLKSFLYISTAYSHCPRNEIDEKFYDPPIKPEALMELVDMIDENKLIQMTPILLGEWPNTYCFTKAVVENLIEQEREHLPLAIVRPSIIIGAVKEPCPGWIDSIYGPTGVLLFGMMGILRTIQGDSEAICDLVPVDYVVNCIVAATYQTAELRKIAETSNRGEITPIYNYCYSPSLPCITWGSYIEGVREKAYDIIASKRGLWWPAGALRKKKYIYQFEVVLNMIPAYVADFIFKLIGREQKAVKLMQRLFLTANVLNYFMRRSWIFSIDNTEKLFESLNSEDQSLFNFDMTKFNIKTYMADYLFSMRIHILHDPIENLKEGQRHVTKLRIFYYLSWILLFAIIVFFVKFLFLLFNW